MKKLKLIGFTALVLTIALLLGRELITSLSFKAVGQVSSRINLNRIYKIGSATNTQDTIILSDIPEHPRIQDSAETFAASSSAPSVLKDLINFPEKFSTSTAAIDLWAWKFVAAGDARFSSTTLPAIPLEGSRVVSTQAFIVGSSTASDVYLSPQVSLDGIDWHTAPRLVYQQVRTDGTNFPGNNAFTFPSSTSTALKFDIPAGGVFPVNITLYDVNANFLRFIVWGESATSTIFLTIGLEAP